MGDFTIFGLPVSLGTMIYQASIFTVLVLLLKKFVFKKLVNIMESRKQYIASQLQLSEKYKSDAEEMLALQNQELHEARKQAIEILKHSEIEADLIIKDAKEEARMILQEARDEAALIRSQLFRQRSHNKGA